MSVIVRLQNLPWAANAVDIRQYFHGLSIPEGGVHIVGGELGDAFIAFSTDEDARQAMLRDGGKVKDGTIKLYLSSRAEMQKIIDQARQQSLGMQQFMSMPTMPPLPVPVTNMPVPGMSVSNVSMPSVPNVPAIQVPLQNVAAMVTNMGKQEPSVIARPPIGSTTGPIQDHSDNNTPVLTSNQSVKSDSEKDKKDKRRRRTRSQSRESSNSRTDSRSRSRSRSSSRSRDRKGRDRHYDRRRKRSRSRDRRRRRDRSRSRERSHRDRKKDHNRHESKEECDENNQSSRWNNPAQRNRQNKPRQDLLNRDSSNQNRINLQQRPKEGPNGEPVKPGFENDTQRQMNPNIPSVSNKESLLTHPQMKETLQHSSDPMVPGSGPPTLSSNTSTTANPQNNQNMPPNAPNFFGSLPPPPMFNAPHLISYPGFNPDGMPPFNTLPSLLQQMPVGNIQQEIISKQETENKTNFGGVNPMKMPPIQPTLRDVLSSPQNKPVQPVERERKSRFTNDVPNDIPLPNNQTSQGGGMPPQRWGYNENNFPFGGPQIKPDSNSQDSFNSQLGWGNGNKNNAYNKTVINTCVQIKNVPPRTSHDDVKAFFQNNQIDPGCLKIIGDGRGNIKAIYVKFNNIGDKKKAICRSGCLLNNSIVSVLHIDDGEFQDATDVMDTIKPYWNSSMEEMGRDKQMSEDNHMMNKKSCNLFCCIKFDGTLRYHPFFVAGHLIHPHIKLLCEKFNPIDVCVVKARGMNNNISAYMKFENESLAEGAVDLMGNMKIDGRMIMVNLCSVNEYTQAKSNCMPMDVQHFLNSVKRPPADNSGKPEERLDPRLQSSSYLDRRMKLDNFDEDDSCNNLDMQNNEDELQEPEFKRSNKVLLPTPSPMVQAPFQNDAGPGPGTNCILLQNLPVQANDRDILDFFADVGVVPTQIHIMLDPNGKQYGDAFCEFEKNEEAVVSSSKDNALMGRNNIRVCLVSRQEMSNALGLSVLTSGPNPLGGPPLGASGPPSLFAGPPMFGNNMRMGGGNDWMQPPLFNPDGPGPMGMNQSNFNNMNDCGFRGNNRGRGDEDFGGRGGRGMNNSGRGMRGNMRGSDMRGGRDFGRDGFGRGGRGGSDMGRGRGGGDIGGRGGRGGSDFGSRGGRGGSDFGSRGGRGGGGGGGDNNRGRGGRGGMRGGPRGGRDMDDYSGRNHPPDLMSLSSGEQNQSGGPQGPMTRPIQLEEDSVREFGHTGCVVSAENVPYRAQLKDILDFFRDYDVSPENIIRRYNDSGQITGDARIAFKTPADAKRAVKQLNNKSIGNRRVNLSIFK